MFSAAKDIIYNTDLKHDNNNTMFFFNTDSPDNIVLILSVY